MSDLNKVLGVCLAFISKELHKNQTLLEQKLESGIKQSGEERSALIQEVLDQVPIKDLPDGLVFESHLSEAVRALSTALDSVKSDISSTVLSNKEDLLESINVLEQQLRNTIQSHQDHTRDLFSENEHILSSLESSISEGILGVSGLLDAKYEALVHIIDSQLSTEASDRQSELSVLKSALYSTISEISEGFRLRVDALESKMDSALKTLDATTQNKLDNIHKKISDLDSSVGSKLSDIESRKSDSGHSHSEYALTEHDHDDLAKRDHGHTEYVDRNEMQDALVAVAKAVKQNQHSIESLAESVADKLSSLDSFPEETRRQITSEVVKVVQDQIEIPKDGKDAHEWEFKWHETIKGRLMFKREDQKDWKYQDLLVKAPGPQYTPMWGGGGGGGSGSNLELGTYTNPDPVPTTLGGIEAGSTFSNVSFDEMFDQLLYPFNVSLAVSPSTAEFGQVVNNATLTFPVKSGATYSINRGIGPVTTSPVISMETITSTTTWTITGVSGSITKTASATLQFLNRIYFGVTPNTPHPTDAEILAAPSQLSNNKNRTVIYDASVGGTGNRYWIAYPARLGPMTNIRVNGLANNAFQVETRQFTNTFGFTENYTIYSSDNLVFGANISVQWS